MMVIAFNEWKDEINFLVNKEIQLNVDELPDLNYRELYDNNNLKIKEVSIIILGEYYKILDKQAEFSKNLLIKSKESLT
jgi:hypothetical protein